MKPEAKIRERAKQDAARVLKAAVRLRAPVEPVAIAEELGIQVLEAEYEQDMLGGLVMRLGEEPRIFLNRRDGILRRKLTCALELGHYVRCSAKTETFSRADRRSDRAGSKVDPELVYAEVFAKCLLVPDLEVRILGELGLDDLEMALRLLVPREVVQSRLSDLRTGSYSPSRSTGFGRDMRTGFCGCWGLSS